MVEVITKHSIDDILDNPSEYVDSSQDLALIRIHGVMIMLGTDSGDERDFDKEAYFVVEDDETSEYYFLCNYPSYSVKDLYEEIVKKLLEV